MIIDNRYLWIPIDNEKDFVVLNLYCDHEKIDEIRCRLGSGKKDFYAYKDMSLYMGKELEIIRMDEKPSQQIFLYPEKPRNILPFNTQIHYEPEIGYMLDPNGLIYVDGIYHMYYQYNPYGITWNNMHWGHATSTDLLHWKEEPIFMYPDETGLKFTGCALLDEQNVLGYGNHAIAYFFTDAGGKSEWSNKHGFDCVQRLAISLDSGKTCFIDKRFELPQYKTLNRDPYVFYHKQSKAYIMCLFLIDTQFAFYRSNDLLHWEKTQEFDINGTWECPTVLEFEVDGEYKMVIWTGQGRYLVGDFDGYTFTPCQSVINGFDTLLNHAAQKMANTGNRTVMINVVLTEPYGNKSRKSSIPLEMNLIKEEEYRLTMKPVQELYDFMKCKEVVSDERSYKFKLDSKASLFNIKWENCKGITKFELLNLTFIFDFNINELIVMNNNEIKLRKTLKVKDSFEAELLVDHKIVELFTNEYQTYATFECDENNLNAKLIMESEYNVKNVMKCS